MTHQKSTHELVKDIQQAGGCSHPVRLRGEFVNVATGEVNERALPVAFKDRRAVVCAACSYLYKADAWIVVSTGLIGGKGVPATIQVAEAFARHGDHSFANSRIIEKSIQSRASTFATNIVCDDALRSKKGFDGSQNTPLRICAYEIDLVSVSLEFCHSTAFWFS